MYASLNVREHFLILIGHKLKLNIEFFIIIGTAGIFLRLKMDVIHESFDYLDNSEDLSFTRNHSGLVNGYSDKPDFEDPAEIRQNLRNAMKGARQRIANLRLDLEEK